MARKDSFPLPDIFHHIVWQFTGDAVEILVDGKVALTQSGVISTDISQLVIGGDIEDTSTSGVFSLMWLRIGEGVLTLEDVESNYESLQQGLRQADNRSCTNSKECLNGRCSNGKCLGPQSQQGQQCLKNDDCKTGLSCRNLLRHRDLRLRLRPCSWFRYSVPARC